MVAEIRAGVVGVGSLGRHHARIYASLPGVKLVGVADIDPQRGAAIAREFGTAYYPDFMKLVTEVECASIVVPTSDHCRVGEPFLASGRHVLMEKPIAATLDEGQALLDMAARSGVLLQVGHLERFNPAFLAVRPLITAPKFFEAHRLSVFVPRCLDVDVILDLMIHDLDLVLSLTVAPVSEIRAVGIPILTGMIDLASVRLEFQDGAVANLTASRVSSEKVRKFRFFQPHDYVSLDLARQSASVSSLRPADTPLGKEVISRDIVVEPGEPLRHEIESFVACVRTGGAPVCSGADGLKALAVARQVLAAIARH